LTKKSHTLYNKSGIWSSRFRKKQKAVKIVKSASKKVSAMRLFCGQNLRIAEVQFFIFILYCNNPLSSLEFSLRVSLNISKNRGGEF